MADVLHGGWASPALSDAYHLVLGLAQTHNHPDDDLAALLKQALEVIEEADVELGGRK